jgi:hypothetical protein
MKGHSVHLIFVVLLIFSGCYSGSRPKGIGGAAQNFLVQDSERQISLSQFRGQVVILNFWAGGSSTYRNRNNEVRPIAIVITEKQIWPQGFGSGSPWKGHRAMTELRSANRRPSMG